MTYNPFILLNAGCLFHALFAQARVGCRSSGTSPLPLSLVRLDAFLESRGPLA